MPRPFEGLPSECDVIALRELVPAGTAPLTLDPSVEGSERKVTLCSLLPMAAPAMVRESGEIWLGLQVQHSFGDPARDLGAVLTKALAAAEAGETGVEDKDSMAGALDQANEAAYPTARLTQVESAYWTNVGTKEHLRWVMPEPEDRLLDALARLHAAGKDDIAPGSRLVGMFRAHGLLAPVWDLPVGTGPEALEDPAAQFAADLAAALADESPLSTEERAARSGLANRQVTIR